MTTCRCLFCSGKKKPHKYACDHKGFIYGCKRCADCGRLKSQFTVKPRPKYSPEVAKAIKDFANAILHGDQEHRDWLLEAADKFILNQEIPPRRG